MNNALFNYVFVLLGTRNMDSELWFGEAFCKICWSKR